MTAVRETRDAQFEQELMNALADAGDCIDFWDIQVKLQALGYSTDDARTSTADDETRRALNERCHRARMSGRLRA